MSEPIQTADETEELVCLVGHITHVFFNMNGKAAFLLKAKDKKTYKCSGDIILEHGEGEYLRIYGKWFHHPRFGKQIQIERWEQPFSGESGTVVAYLASAKIKGLGEKLAKAIVDKLGPNAVEIIVEQGEEVLYNIPKLGKKKAEVIYRELFEKIKNYKTISFLMENGLSSSLAHRVYEHFEPYGKDIIELIKRNPYRIMELQGVGFTTADTMGFKLGFEQDSPFRLQAGAKHYLQEMAFRDSHCYLDYFKWIMECVRKLFPQAHWSDTDINIDKVQSAVEDLEAEDQIVAEKILGSYRAYPKILWRAEDFVAKWLAKRIANQFRNNIDGKKLAILIKEFEQKEDKELSETQKKAIKEALCSSFFILTGNPGTGKTTVTNAIIYCYERLFPDRRKLEIKEEFPERVGLSAPTGRAAKRMEEVSKKIAKTIHRLLGFKQGGQLEYNHDNPLPYDLIIVDESSMIDILLIEKLFAAIRPNTQVVLVGDSDQLPSVGPGMVLRDLLSIAQIPAVRLDEIYRQAKTSNIIMNAHRIRNGEDIKIGNDFFFVDLNEDLEIQKRVLLGVRKLVMKGHSASDIQVLAAMKDGEVGTRELNRLLQQSINPPAYTKKEILHKFANFERIFRVGDKVMQIENNYDKVAFNGEVGIITDIDVRKNLITIQFNDHDEETEYSREEFSQIEHSYAITIHKSQGGEYPIVLMAISERHTNMLNRNLIYTGITRAKTLCGVIGSKRAFTEGVAKEMNDTRNTSLKEKILIEFEAIRNRTVA